MKRIPLDIALRAARRLCDAADVDLVLPGDRRREAVLYALAAWHSLRGTGWDLATLRGRVCVAVPGLGAALDLLPPVVGVVLREIAGDLRRPMVMLAPAATTWGGVRLMGTVAHERGHIGSMRAGGPLWCLAYGLVPEVVAGAEAPCYGADLAHAVLLGGEDVSNELDHHMRALGTYGLDAPATELAHGILRSHAAGLRAGADPGGTVADSLAALAAEGWTP